MIDFKRWIYSPDIARWLSGGRDLDLDEQMDCILSAPHRTLEEKLESLRELRREAAEMQRPEGAVGARIRWGGRAVAAVCEFSAWRQQDRNRRDQAG